MPARTARLDGFETASLAGTTAFAQRTGAIYRGLGCAVMDDPAEADRIATR